MKIPALTALVVLMGTLSCSSNRNSFPPDSGFYKKEELKTFFRVSDQGRTVDARYIISIGDMLDVVFPIDDELTSRDLIVRRDGRISLPYIGDQMAAGFTPMELDSILTKRFESYLRTPELSVIVKKVNQRLIYVVGEVKRPGGFPTDRSISVMQAITLAGGFMSGAKRDHVVVIRRMGSDRIVGVEVDVEGILEGSALQQDFLLKDFDIVFVPKTRLKTVSEFAEQFQQIIDPPFSIITRGWQIVYLTAAFEYYRSPR